MAHHLMVGCRYTKRIWDLVADWLKQPQLKPLTWEPTDNAKDWWTMMGTRAGVPRKGLHSLILLVVWEIWKERNARTFQKKKEVSTVSLQNKIEEARAWGLSGAKALRSLVSCV